jgi:LacI family gluconate utilization system Gnt-I transcriptional repressor
LNPPSNEISRMEDVAREAGVARVTVSRALSHPDKVSPATRAAVRAAIERLGYVPNLTAGSLASKRSRIIGAIVPTLCNSWFADAMDGLAETLGAAGYQLMLGQSGYHIDQEAGLVDAFLGRKVDGLILTGVVHAPSVRERLRRNRLPVVEIWDMTDDPIDTVVGFSNLLIGEAVASYLLQRGHRRIGFIGANEIRSGKRAQGLRQRLQAEGLGVAQATPVTPPSVIEDGARGLAELLALEPQLQAVFCSNDTLGVGALFECRRRGLRVPQDIAVVGFSDLAIAAACVPALTTVQVNSRELGRRAALVLLQRLGSAPAEEAAPSRVIDLGFQIIEREST